MQVEQLGHAQLGERLGPDTHGARRALLLEYDLPVFIAQADEITVVVEIDELLACAALLLASEAGSYITGTTLLVDGGVLARVI